MEANSARQIKWGAVISYVSIALNLLAGLLYTPWMIDKIGKADYGLYTLGTSVISIFLVDFGLSAAVNRYVARYRAEGRQQDIDNFLGLIYKLYIVIDVFILFIFAVLYFYLGDIYVKLTVEELGKTKSIFIIIALFSLINFPFVTLNGILNSYEKFIALKMADIIYRLLLVGGTVLFLSLGYGLFALVNVHVGVGMIVLLYKLIVIKKTIPVRINWRYREKGLFVELFRFSVWTTVGLLAQRLIFNITPSILGMVASSAAIAVFGIIGLIEGYMYVISNALGSMFMPRVSQICTGMMKDAQLNSLMVKVGKFQHSLNGVMVAVFLAVGHDFILLWVGEEYSAAYLGAALIVTPALFSSSMQIAHTAAIVENKVKLLAKVYVSIGVLNVILSFILSSFMGVTGAALAIAIVYLLRVVMLMGVYRRVLSIDVAGFCKSCYIRMSIPIVVSVLAGVLLNHLLADVSWMYFLVKCALITLVYGLALLYLSCTRDERKVLLGYMRLKA